LADIRLTVKCFGDLPIAGPGREHLPGREPYLLAAGPRLRAQPAAVGISHVSGMNGGAQRVIKL
jgi:hypothetical protein